MIGSQRFYGSDIDDLSRPVTGRTFGYGYDPIGNRVSSFEDAGGERLTTTYTANELNQYTAIQNSGSVPLRGDAKREAVVTVNGEQTERDNGTAAFTPWSYSLPSGAATAHFQNADILAVAQNAAGEDVEQRESGSVFAPAAETILEYDDDGNMTFDGRFRYSWNGENRMIRAEEAVVPTNRAPTIITYAYDEQGRMVAKNIAGTNAIVRSLLCDGYNIVRETDNGGSTYNIWGLDLDGTLQGCGGVGGLLAVAKPSGLHVALYDANGNISDYVSANGSYSAHYEYSPFGEPLVSFGDTFMHQFSTKPYCPSTGLSEYQLRKYNSMFGRWQGRDPISEASGRNLFTFVSNNCNRHFDFLGLTEVSIQGHVISLKGKSDPRAMPNMVFDITVTEPPEPGCSLNFIALKFVDGEWSLDHGNDNDPYYLKTAQFSDFSFQNLSGQTVIRFADSPGGPGQPVEVQLFFYMLVVESCTYSCVKDEIFLKYYLEKDVKVIASRFWSAIVGGMYDKQFEFSEDSGLEPEPDPTTILLSSGELETTLQNLINGKTWNRSGPIPNEMKLHIHL